MVERELASRFMFVQSLPLLLPDLLVLVNWVEAQLKVETDAKARTEWLFALAYMCTTWYLWCRMDEVLSLQYQHVSDNATDPGYPGQILKTITLTFRKTNQADARKGRVYQVHDPTNPDERPVAVWHHLQNWVKHVRAFTHVDAKPHFFLFPVIDKFGGVDIEKRMSAATWQSMFDRIVHDSGLGDKYSNGNFTGHCMRRGGAQWRFGEDPAVKWALQASIWWGGWAEGEAVGTIGRYLLEERNQHEASYSDQMNPERNHARRSIQSSSTDLQIAKTGDIAQLREEMNRLARVVGREMDGLRTTLRDQELDRPVESIPMAGILGQVADAVVASLLAKGLVGPATISAGPVVPAQASTSSSSRPFESSERRVENMLAPAASHVNAQGATTTPFTELRLRRSGEIMGNRPPKIPKTSTVKEAVKQWFQAGGHEYHYYALQDWPKQWYSGAKGGDIVHKSIQVIYGQRSRLGMAYSMLNEGATDFTEEGWVRFETKYPEKKMTDVLEAIRNDLAASGKITNRPNRKQNTDK
ncbi:hypothetical protein HD553DRAFT_345692 [Filobasidium floriforme]|uniref:uncharacterized protein n=1 Tax=Filobasidium floriforme TaxID=5210 RepID=UPI001E8DAAB6|nr:uncharacterized protein HD553DRAFT_345692 [Filobasidium floriforme]KAH8079351.1 hypothetical protein HD553DRAFT_345692 [Filobasidium floriforme]